MSEEKKKSPWGKILKLFLEFVVAAVTALLGAGTMKACGLF